MVEVGGKFEGANLEMFELVLFWACEKAPKAFGYSVKFASTPPPYPLMGNTSDGNAYKREKKIYVNIMDYINHW